MNSRPSDPRSRGGLTRGQNTRSWVPHRGSSPYQPRHVDSNAEYSRDPRLKSHRGQGQGSSTAHVVAGGTSYHSRTTGSNHDPRSFSMPPAPSMTPQFSNDSVVHRNTSDQESRYLSPSQPPQPRPLFPTATATDHGHTIGHTPQSSHHTAPSPQQHTQQLHRPPRDGSVALPPPPPSWFNPSHPAFPMMTHPPQPPFSQPTISTPPPFTSTRHTALPPPPTSGAYPLSVMGPLPPPPPFPPAAGSPLPFPTPPGGLPPPLLPLTPPNFPLPLPIIPTPSHTFTPRFIPPSLQQTQKYVHISFDSKGEVPGFKPAPSPVGIEERLGLKKEKNEGEGEGSREMKRLSSEEDASDCFISEWLKQVEGSYLMHQQHRQEVKWNSIKVCC